MQGMRRLALRAATCGPGPQVENLPDLQLLSCIFPVSGKLALRYIRDGPPHKPCSLPLIFRSYKNCHLFPLALNIVHDYLFARKTLARYQIASPRPLGTNKLTLEADLISQIRVKYLTPGDILLWPQV